jgi:hypothetical protein
MIARVVDRSRGLERTSARRSDCDALVIVGTLLLVLSVVVGAPLAACAHSAGKVYQVDCGDFASPTMRVLVEDWRNYPIGLKGAPGDWSHYGRFSASMGVLQIVSDEGRHALQVRTLRQSAGLGKQITLDLTKTPFLTWQWKSITIPRHGDVRGRINDQVARLYVLVGATRAIGYIWDSTAPVGTVVGRQWFLFERRLLVVRSGPAGLGAWRSETRNVLEDFTKLFGVAAQPVRGIALESHSEDADHETDVLIGSIVFHE